jgi:hypothetical protein
MAFNKSLLILELLLAIDIIPFIRWKCNGCWSLELYVIFAKIEDFAVLVMSYNCFRNNVNMS